MTSPFIRVVTYSVLDGWRLALAHDCRHLEQARRVASSPGFRLADRWTANAVPAGGVVYTWTSASAIGLGVTHGTLDARAVLEGGIRWLCASPVGWNAAVKDLVDSQRPECVGCVADPAGTVLMAALALIAGVLILIGM